MTRADAKIWQTWQNSIFCYFCLKSTLLCRGVIVNTMNNAFKVAASLVEDLDSLSQLKPGQSPFRSHCSLCFEQCCGSGSVFFGPLGPGSISTRYRSGSGFFYNQAKILRKKPAVLWFLYDFLSLKNYVNVASKSKQKKNLKKILVAILKVTNENYRVRSRIRIRLSKVRIRNVKDPQHWFRIGSLLAGSGPVFVFLRICSGSGSPV
jgi:hypothetical protein